MPISKSSELFSLVKSLSKAEKRNFKLYANRNHLKGQLKFIELFEILEKAETFDKKQILKQLKGVPESKLPNLKRHLYTQILSSLRVITVSINDGSTKFVASRQNSNGSVEYDDPIVAPDKLS